MLHAFPGFRARIPEITAALLLLAAPARAQAPNPVGDWLTEDKLGVITIAPCGDALCGSITGVSQFPPGGLRDVHGAPECQLVFIKGMRPGDDGKRHGTVDNPQDGKTYQAQLWVDGDVLKLRGYLLSPWLGSTRSWTRFTGKRAPDCHFSQG